jgi:DNA-binding transcriptional LysR family regulator
MLTLGRLRDVVTPESYMGFCAHPLEINLKAVFSTLLAKFMVEHLQIFVDVDMTDQHVNVIEGKYDLVLRLTNKLEDSSLLCKRIKMYKFVTCASP